MVKTIVFDLRALQIGHENRGIGMVVRSVLDSLEDDHNHYLFYIFDSSNPIDELGISLKIKNYEFVSTPKLKTTVVKPVDLLDAYKLSHHRFTKLRHYRPDIFLQFDFALGLPSWKKTKNLCIGYDLIPLIMQSQYLPSVKMIWNQPFGRRTKIKGSIRSIYYWLRARKQYSNFKKTHKILCISEATKQSFIDILHIGAKKLEVLPLAPVIPDEEAPAKNLIKKPYVFYVGGTDYRKHVADVVSAFNIAKGRGQDIGLVLAGNEFKEVKNIPDVEARTAILNSPYSKDIRLAGFISDQEKVGLYRHALAFIFCSTYEGFGLPVLEAQAMGCPVISYNNSSIPEVASKSVALVKDGDYSSIAENIQAIAKGNREKITKDGVQFTKKFTWQKYCSDLLKFLENS